MSSTRSILVTLTLLAGLACSRNRAGADDVSPPTESSPAAWRAVRRVPAAEAVQAAAADREFLFAVSSTQVARYRRDSGERTGVSRGAAKHLNSAYLWEGRLYCAHSNYPEKPELSEIRVLDLSTLELTTYHNFGDAGGSLTWCVRHDGDWWCHFAYYGADNGQSYLARFDGEWRELGRWTIPPEVLRELGRYSLSGGVFVGAELLVTGHDDPVVFQLQVPEAGNVLAYRGRARAPFTGQGIAVDPVTGGLVGIDRGRREIVLAERESPLNR